MTLEQLDYTNISSIYCIVGKLRETDTKDIKIVAIKIFKTKISGIDFEKEMKVLKAMEPHPHLVSFYGYSTELKCIVLELVLKGDLKKYLKSKKPKSGKPKIHLAKSVGMAYQVRFVSQVNLLKYLMVIFNLMDTQLMQHKNV